MKETGSRKDRRLVELTQKAKGKGSCTPPWAQRPQTKRPSVRGWWTSRSGRSSSTILAGELKSRIEVGAPSATCPHGRLHSQSLLAWRVHPTRKQRLQTRDRTSPTFALRLPGKEVIIANYVLALTSALCPRFLIRKLKIFSSVSKDTDFCIKLRQYQTSAYGNTDYRDHWYWESHPFDIDRVWYKVSVFWNRSKYRPLETCRMRPWHKAHYRDVPGSKIPRT